MNQITKGQLKTAIEAFCLDPDRNLEKLIGEPLYIGTVKTITGPSERKMTPVYKNDQKYFADIITGTLYKPDGECMSSTNMRLIVAPSDQRRKIAKKDLRVS